MCCPGGPRLLGLLLGVLLSLVFDSIWIPLFAGMAIGVLYLQLRWTQLILAEWREGITPAKGATEEAS